MSDYDAKRFIAENTSDRRTDTSEDPAPQSVWAVIDMDTLKTEGVSNSATAHALAHSRGHMVLDRGTGRVYTPRVPIVRTGNPYGLPKR